MVKTGFSSANKDYSYTQLICECCGKDLGVYSIEKGKVHNDIEDWKFCPYCGNELYDDEI